MRRKSILAVAAILTLAFSGSTASALPLTVGGAYYMGWFDPNMPANAASDVDLINYLRTLAAGATADDVDIYPGPPEKLYDFSRVGSTVAGAFPVALFAGKGGVDNCGACGGELNSAGFAYVLGKYGNTAHVWFINGALESVDLPNTAMSFGNGTADAGLSNYGLYNPGTVPNVPDGGATIGLLGFAMLGAGYLRRRLS